MRGRWLAKLAILLAVLALPAFVCAVGIMLARVKAAEAVCSTNEAKLAAALVSYRRDHHDIMPDAGKWCDELLAYVGDKRVFICPASFNQDRQKRCDYAYNAALSRAQYSAIKEPDKIVLFFESDQDWNGSGGLESAAKDRHNVGSNVTFLDGHAKWIPVEKLRKLQWQPQLKEQPSGK